jgi:glyoxylase-like metal-dependent hydrolase (beta-lactamase superfamily II)
VSDAKRQEEPREHAAARATAVGSAPSAEDSLRAAAAVGIHRLAIPTPFQVGRVNAYLIEDSPLTLLDSGPNSAKALDELEQALAAVGHAVEDIELLIVSHQHMDHFGLASILARRSGAEVAALETLAPFLAAYGRQTDLDDQFAEGMMLRHGIPPEVVTALRAVSAGFRAWGSAVEVTRTLADGEELRLRDRTLRVLHRPGHSPSDTVFLDEGRGILLAADHLIKHISSNPLLARPLGCEPDVAGPRPQALVTYLQSLSKTRAMDLSLVLAGHGEPITDHAALIDERFRLHKRRAEKIGGLIASQPRTAHEIAHELWGNVAVTQAYLTLSEVLGHVDLLLDDARVVEVEQDGVVHFAAA